MMRIPCFESVLGRRRRGSASWLLLLFAWGIGLLLAVSPASGQTLPTGPELGEFLSTVMDSVSVRTNEYRGWPDGAIRLRIQNPADTDEPPLEEATLAVLQGRDDVVGVCAPSSTACEGGDYVMLTRFVETALVSEDTATVRVVMSGDDGARGDPSTGFGIGWGVTLVRDQVWMVTGVELLIVSRP
jgi:hypothetical protein